MEKNYKEFLATLSHEDLLKFAEFCLNATSLFDVVLTTIGDVKVSARKSLIDIRESFDQDGFMREIESKMENFFVEEVKEEKDN
jgi:hypothetical protein